MNQRMRNIGILKELEERSKEISEVKILIGIIEDITREATVLLNRVTDTFPEYTLHEKTHALNILKIIDLIIPKETLLQMNELELTILILSAFLHDIGMVVARKEKKKILQSEHFNHFKEKYSRINNSFKVAQKQGKYRIATQIEDQLLTYYLREMHAVRGAEFIKKKFGSKLKYSDLDFSDLICRVCRSHDEPWERLGVRSERLHGYPLREEYPTSHSIGNLEVNVQFLAIVLRIADTLDFDRERTPSILYEYLYPIGKISLAHWLTHLSVQGWSIGKDRIKYRVECEHPLYQKTVSDFIDIIDAELQGARLLVEKFPREIAEKYKLYLPMAVDRSEIGPKIVEGKPSYIYGDFKFGLDYDRVIALLGEELHYDETIAIRELLQNSVDACIHRLALEKTLGTNWNEKNVKIHFVYDSTTQKLSVRDNGIGMDQAIVQNHFLRIGCSYYSEENSRYLQDIAMFRKNRVTFYPISKFGIGILSCFLLANQIEVKTRRKLSHGFSNPLCIEINSELKMYVMKELDHSSWRNPRDSGTEITLHLTHPIDLKRELERFAINLKFNISATINGLTTIIKPRGFDINAFPKFRKQISNYLKGKKMLCYEVNLSKSKIKGLRGKTTLFFPSVRGRALILEYDNVNPSDLGIEASLVKVGRYESEGLAVTLTSNQGIHVPSGLEISLPFLHLTAVDFFGESRPELTLDRRRFKRSLASIRKRLLDFLSTELRKAICNGAINFHSPFWEVLWTVDTDIQDFFLRDKKARNDLLKMPLLIGEKQEQLTFSEIRKHFQTGVCVVFRRHKMKEYSGIPEGVGSYSSWPQDLPLLAIDTSSRGQVTTHEQDQFWRQMFSWSKLTLIENGEYYYLNIQLRDLENPIYRKIKELITYDYSELRDLRFAEYNGIAPSILYSNNFALALNKNHPTVNLFLSCLEKTDFKSDLGLMRDFGQFLVRIALGSANLEEGKSLAGKLEKHGLIGKNETKILEINSLCVRDIAKMTHLFLQPVPVAFRRGYF